MKSPTSNAAASSTPAAALPGSHLEDEVQPAAAADAGADTEDVTSADIGAALAQLSDEPRTATEEEPGAPEKLAEGAEAPAAGAEEQPASEAAAGETGTEAAPSGEGAAEVPVDDEKKAKPAEGEAKPGAEDEAQKKLTGSQERINELTARSKTAEDALAKANERLAALDAANSGRLEPSVLENVDTLDALAAKRSQLIKLHQWALTHPGGGELKAADGKSDPIAYDADAVANMAAATFELIHEALPAREQYLRSREQSDAQAVTSYPWIKDTRNGAGAQVQAMIEAKPGIRRLGPEYRLIAADALIGQTLREAGIAVDGKLVDRLKAEAKTRKVPGAGAPVVAAAVARRIPPAAPSRPGVVPARAAPGAAAARSAQKSLSKSDGNLGALTASIAAKFG